jgi:thioredoxin reductase (NADPH)
MGENLIYELAIIGGGPAGLAAALYAKRAALNAVLIERGTFGGQVAITKYVENYLGFKKISGLELSEKFLEHAQSSGIELIRKEVEGLTPGPELHSVKLEGNQTIHAGAVILATGSSPRKLNVPGEQRLMGKGVSYCATCDGFFFKDQKVVVVGAGDTATEETLYLSKIVKRVHMVHIEPTMQACKILQNRLMGQCNVEIHPNSTVAEIEGDENRVTSVRIKEVTTGRTREIAASGVFIFIGLSPNNQLIPPGVRTTPGGHVITDEKCETSIPGIFAIGDLRHKYAKQISIAVGDGAIGALAAAHYIERKKEEKTFCELYLPAA